MSKWTLIAAVALLAGCAGSSRLIDTNAAVDANPACTSRADRPGEPVSRDCERIQGGEWSSKPARSQPIDFGGKRDD